MIHGEKGQMLTIIQDESGSRECPLNGNSRWASHEVGSGISGKLSDFLSCAGISLDDYNREALSGGATESGVPTYRITGYGLKLQMYYHNSDLHDEDFDGTVCYVKIHGSAMWNSNQVCILHDFT